MSLSWRQMVKAKKKKIQEAMKLSEEEMNFVLDNIGEFCRESDEQIRIVYGDNCNVDKVVDNMSESMFMQMTTQVIKEVLEKMKAKKKKKKQKEKETEKNEEEETQSEEDEILLEDDDQIEYEVEEVDEK